MPLFQKKKLSKATVLLLQVIALASLFLFFFSREAIFIFKDFVDRIPLDVSIESLIYRLLLPFKLLSNSPSICAVFFLVMHIFCATHEKNLWIYQNTLRYNYKAFDISVAQNANVNESGKEEDIYLHTMRLLF